MYQRFFQLDGSMTREHGGLGVGLAICRQLVDLLGGQLTHRSEPGRGSRFQLDVEFQLPLGEPVAAPMIRDLPHLRLPQECTVLLVDNNDIHQLLMRGMLLKLGFRVRTADDGVAALDFLRRETFDAVLLDSELPQMNGVSLCCQIRALPGCEHVPVFMIVLNVDRERCVTADLIHYLSKPVKFEDLQAAMYRRVLCPQQGESADS